MDRPEENEVYDEEIAKNRREAEAREMRIKERRRRAIEIVDETHKAFGGDLKTSDELEAAKRAKGNYNPRWYIDEKDLAPPKYCLPSSKEFYRATAMAQTHRAPGVLNLSKGRGRGKSPVGLHQYVFPSTISTNHPPPKEERKTVSDASLAKDYKPSRIELLMQEAERQWELRAAAKETNIETIELPRAEGHSPNTNVMDLPIRNNFLSSPVHNSMGVPISGKSTQNSSSSLASGYSSFYNRFLSDVMKSDSLAMAGSQRPSQESLAKDMNPSGSSQVLTLTTPPELVPYSPSFQYRSSNFPYLVHRRRHLPSPKDVPNLPSPPKEVPHVPSFASQEFTLPSPQSQVPSFPDRVPPSPSPIVVEAALPRTPVNFSGLVINPDGYPNLPGTPMSNYSSVFGSITSLSSASMSIDLPSSSCSESSFAITKRRRPDTPYNHNPIPSTDSSMDEEEAHHDTVPQARPRLLKQICKRVRRAARVLTHRVGKLLCGSIAKTLD